MAKTVPTEEVFVADPVQRRLACVMLAAALGGNPSFAHHFDASDWIIDGDTSGLRRFGPMNHTQVKHIAESWARRALTEGDSV